MQIHKTEAADLRQEVEDLERDNLVIMADLFECKIEDLKVSRYVKSHCGTEVKVIVVQRSASVILRINVKGIGELRSRLSGHRGQVHWDTESKAIEVQRSKSECYRGQGHWGTEIKVIGASRSGSLGYGVQGHHGSQVKVIGVVLVCRCQIYHVRVNMI